VRRCLKKNLSEEEAEREDCSTHLSEEAAAAAQAHV
jgi:hypothetical protein